MITIAATEDNTAFSTAHRFSFLSPNVHLDMPLPEDCNAPVVVF